MNTPALFCGFELSSAEVGACIDGEPVDFADARTRMRTFMKMPRIEYAMNPWTHGGLLVGCRFAGSLCVELEELDAARRLVYRARKRFTYKTQNFAARPISVSIIEDSPW